MRRTRLVTLILVSCVSCGRAAVAGPWTLAPGAVYVRLTGSTEATDEYFCPGHETDARSDCSPGERTSFDPVNGGHWEYRGLSADLLWGAAPQVTLGLSGSVADARYDDRAGKRRTTGFGDTYASAQYAFSAWPVASAIMVRVKAPTGESPADPTLIPLSEKQWDVESTFSIGRSFWPRPAYAYVEGGYRYRAPTSGEDPERDLGDEIPFRAEAGATLARVLSLRSRVEGFVGRTGTTGPDSATVKTPRRAIVSVVPSIALALARGSEAEVAVSFPLAGRAYPASTTLRVALAATLGGRKTR